jgi:response regulator RpfG family c-di-GMP phosphodiesterase
MNQVRHIVIGIHISDRVHHVPGVQNLLTEYGCSIKTRIGLHAVNENYCSPNGLILLEMAGPEKPTFELVEKLKAIDGVDAQTMVFEHE